MLNLVFISALLTSIDNLIVCSALSLLPLSREQRRWYAFAFSAAETFAAVAGMSLGAVFWPALLHSADQSVPIILLLCGVILALGWFNRDAARLFGRPGMIVGLPLLMSIDNLVAGIGLSAAKTPPLATALIIGFAGSIMSCAGLLLGSSLRKLIPLRASQFSAGTVICCFSIWMLVRG
jgi:manganese efflux pump family protein